MFNDFKLSGHSFDENEVVKYKFIFLNHVIGFASFVSFIMGFIRISQNNLVLGYIDLFFALLSVYLLKQLRVSKEKIEFIASILILAAYILFTSIFLFADNQANRLTLFFLLLASAYFLKGKNEGKRWLLLIVLTINGIHFSGLVHTNHSILDMLTVTLYLIAMYFIMDLYEHIKDAQTNRVRYINENLEKIIEDRTIQLEELNRALELEKHNLELISSTDQLTGLHNRYQIKEIFDSLIFKAQHKNINFSVILLDLDHFKNINDTFGHNIGDQFLKNIAEILKVTMRDDELIVRWGGEEFIIFVQKANQKEIFEIAERLRKKIELYEFDNVGHRTASFGVSTYQESDTFEAIIQRADHALYESKKNGRNKVSIG